MQHSPQIHLENGCWNCVYVCPYVVIAH